MKGYNKWNFKPYVPYNCSSAPYICAIQPYDDGFCAQCSDGCVRAYYSKRGSNVENSIEISGNSFCVSGLDTQTDYSFYVVNKDGTKSAPRLVRTGTVPGTVVNYLHPEDAFYKFSGRFLCSPSLVKLPGGILLASMDVFASNMPQNLTLLFRSDDGGKSWYYINELFPCFWGKLFWHNNELYMLATSTEYGDVLVGKSSDFGETWSEPTVIFRGSCSPVENGFHKAPVPIVRAGGRIWTAVEYGSWPGKTFSAALLSIDEKADLLCAENWELTPPLPHSKDWAGALDVCGPIEGNVVVTPEGELVNIMRYAKGRAAVLKCRLDLPHEPLSFGEIIDFPLGHTKFEILQKDGYYYAVGNQMPARDVLSIFVSKDLKNWKFGCDVLNYSECDSTKIGFQYPSCCFDGDDLLVLSRTAFNGAASYHDNNYITFHRIPLSNVDITL